MHITIATLGDIKEHGYSLHAHCSNGMYCGNSKILDIDGLIARHGADYDFVERKEIEPRLRCERCKTLGGKLTLHPPSRTNAYAKAKGG